MGNARIRTAAAVSLLAGIAIAMPDIARAVDMNPNAPVQRPAAAPPTQQGKTKPATESGKDKNWKFWQKWKKKKKEESERKFMDGYRAAHALIYQNGDYAGGIAALHAIGQDGHPDVANLIGFANRKLGHYEDAKVWYEKALAADPRHARTWSYYGMWHAEQGNRLKAEDYLETVRSICGTGCREYVELKGVIEGTLTY
jgi:tetratricopeptide (TPR) repeat protein